MSIQFEKCLIKDVYVISVTGSLKAGSEFDLEELITKYMSEFHFPKIVIDVTKVDYMNSSVLSIFIDLYDLVEQKNGYFGLCGMSSSVSKLFSLTKLDTVVEIFRNQEEAIESFSS